MIQSFPAIGSAHGRIVRESQHVSRPGYACSRAKHMRSLSLSLCNGTEWQENARKGLRTAEPGYLLICGSSSTTLQRAGQPRSMSIVCPWSMGGIVDSLIARPGSWLQRTSFCLVQEVICLFLLCSHVLTSHARS